MADELPNVSTVGILRADEALRELKHLPDGRRRRGPAKSGPPAEDEAAEQDTSEDELLEQAAHSLDVNA